MRRPGYNWKLDQKSCDFWVIVNSGDILVNLFTEEVLLNFLRISSMTVFCGGDSSIDSLVHIIGEGRIRPRTGLDSAKG